MSQRQPVQKDMRKAILAVRFLNNHLHRSGSATDLITATLYDECINEDVRREMDAATRSAAKYLKDVFDGSR